MTRPQVVFLTEEEIKALANAYRVALKLGGHIPYIQELESNGGKSGFDKLMVKIKEINHDSNG